jgi:hypothetical protein
MSRSWLIIGILLAGLALGGCAAPPWSSQQNLLRTPALSTADKSVSAASAAGKSSPQNPLAPVPNSPANAQAMQEIMAELHQLGALDPAAQNKLMDDLRQTDPALWPLVMQQFRAAIAYKRRMAAHEAMALSGTLPVSGSAAASSSLASGSVGATSPLPTGNLAAGDLAVNSSLASTTVAPSVGQSAERVSRLPPAGNVQPVFNPAPKNTDQAAVKVPADSQSAKSTPEGPQPKQSGKESGVISASYDAPSPSQPGDWQGDLTSAIKALEGTASSDPKTAEQLAQQARLRMLYVLAGRRDDALKPIPSAPPAMQEFWTKELYGLAMLLDSEKTPDAIRRAAESKQVLSEAISRLGETAPLVVRNLAFCTAIQSYGCTTPFKKYEFVPDQEALLYAEMENFASESTAKGYHTQLRSSYQILDSAGQRVADHTFTTTEEYCQNARRDFFIGYHLRMPKRINPGRYTLQLTIEDLKSQKVGQSSIEFTIKEAEK